MIERIIEYSVRNKFLVILLTAVAVVVGVYCLLNIKLDAIPDLSDVQVIIKTDYPGQAPQIVEDQVTYPLTTAMLAVPRAKVVRGYSFFDYSLVFVIFEDGTDLYWARSRVLEYLNFAQGRLPQGINPQLGPDATSVGWIYEYTVEDTSGRYDLSDLRSVQDWYLKYQLTSVPGVAEVASVGGFVKQYQVEVDPARLLAYNIPLSQVKEAIMKSNSDVGGGVIEMGETEFMVRGLGYIKNLEDLRNIGLGVTANGTPVLLRNVADVKIGPEMRRGLAEKNGQGEVVGGIVVMRYGENALKTIQLVKKKMEGLKPGLPAGVVIRPAYDRSELIHASIKTLSDALIQELIIVALFIMIFLVHIRSSLVSIFVLPSAVLISFILMYFQGINANIMSLAGIILAIGALVDSSMVMVENAHKHLERYKGETGGAGFLSSKERWMVITGAAKEVGPSLFYSMLVTTVAFIPIFLLEEQEGRLFRPLAFTKSYAMLAGALLSITIVPVLMGYWIRGRIRSEEQNPISRFLHKLYHPVIDFVLRHRRGVIVTALALMALTIIPVLKIGSEFMPPLYEGDLLYMPTTFPGISITKAREVLQQTDKIISSFPEVETVFGKIGRAETATDPAPLMMIETTIKLKPKKQWRPGMTPDKLVDEMNRAIQFPGLTNAWTMPIKTRIDMLSTGIKTPVGIKIMGENLDSLTAIGERIEASVRKVKGTLSVYAERIVGGNYIDYKINRLEAARYGLTVGDVQEVIMSALGGDNVTSTVEGLQRYPVNVRYPRELRDNLEDIKRLLVPTPSGAQIPIVQLADIQVVKGPDNIKSENSRRTAWVYVDIKGIDVGTYVKQAKKVVESEVAMPSGYNLVWSGQYEYMLRAQKRLMTILPLVILVIFFIMYHNTKSITKTFIVFLAVPFSLIGAFWFLYLLGYNLSVAIWVGMIALAGVDAETGVVMLLFLDLAYHDRLKANAMRTKEDLRQAIHYGAVKRIRPKLMTVGTDMVALLPVFWATGIGSDVAKRIAAPYFGGLITSFLLELLVYPVIFYIWHAKRLPEGAASQMSESTAVKV
ncbi:MAG: CusA/CzcA family heavy metal efflux RND transporter [Candidatus Zixiibacteriota bacterium]